MTDLPFSVERPEDSPGFLLWQTTMVWQRLIKKSLEKHNISHAQFVIMATLLWLEAHGYETTQSLIANWTKLDKMTVSKSLKILGALSLVSRSENEIDTRSKNVFLTKKGKHFTHQLVPIIEKIDSEFFSVLSAEKQSMLITILRELAR